VVISKHNLHLVANLARGKLNVDWALFAAIFAERKFLSPVLTILVPVERLLDGLTSFDPGFDSEIVGFDLLECIVLN